LAYSLRMSDESVDAGIRRIAVSQLETGLSELRDETLSQHQRVRQARKRCKKMRGLVRLVRPVFPGFEAENAAFRDAARTLSPLRDASAVLESVDALEQHFSTQLKKAALAPLRRALEAERESLDEDEIEERLSDMRLVFREALDRVPDWSLEANGADAFTPGARKTYKRARKAMQKARKSRIAEDFHEWRKPMKYHWYQIRLLKKVWPPVMKEYGEQAEQLCSDLGEHHDLAVLRMTAQALLGASSDTAELVEGLAIGRQHELEKACIKRGKKLLAEAPDDMTTRWAQWWDSARQPVP